VQANPKLVMSALKDIISNDQHLFKRYGKPSKNFDWPGVGKGVNAALVTQALAKARGQEVAVKTKAKAKLNSFKGKPAARKASKKKTTKNSTRSSKQENEVTGSGRGIWRERNQIRKGKCFKLGNTPQSNKSNF
jgi:hypothetical protein